VCGFIVVLAGAVAWPAALLGVALLICAAGGKRGER
jgi:hypothetical protein